MTTVLQYSARMTSRSLYVCVPDPSDSAGDQSEVIAPPSRYQYMIQFGKTGKATDFRGRTGTVGHACITLLRELTPFLSM